LLVLRKDCHRRLTTGLLGDEYDTTQKLVGDPSVAALNFRRCYIRRHQTQSK
jgi:hypothetical protein